MNTVLIADPEILAIPIKENGESLVDIKDSTELQYGPVPENEYTQDDYTKMRITVYKKVLNAQKQLPNNWRFRLYEGYRSRKVQKILFDEMHSHTAQRYPELNAENLFHETTTLVSPVVNFDGSINIPVHNTGAAVDIEIIDEQGQLIDMGMTAADWTTVEPDLCRTDYEALSPTILEHRKILLDVMTQQGFVNYPTEWWHYSFGDRYWAYHKKKSHAIYGSADELIS